MEMLFCQMCGAKNRDLWETRQSRRVTLSRCPRFSDNKTIWTICNECNEGLQNTALPKHDRVHLLAQVRRATIDDQEALLNWLLGKFGLVSKKKP